MTTSRAALWARMGGRSREDFWVTSDRTISHGAFQERVRRALGTLDAAAPRTGDRVLILTEDELAAVTWFVAAWLDGLVPCMLPADSPSGRVHAIANSLAPRIVVTDGHRGRPAGVAPDAYVHHVGQGADAPWWQRIASMGRARSGPGREPHAMSHEADLAYVLFTSGTTAAPRGVCISHQALASQLNTLARLYHVDPEARLHNSLVLAHADALVQGPLLALWTGAAVIRPGGFDIQNMEGWLDGIRAHRATHVYGVPTIWSLVLRYACHDDYFEAPECRVVISCAGQLRTSTWKAFEARFHKPLHNQYGLTETTTTCIYAGPHPEMGSRGSLGAPVDAEARVRSLDDETLLTDPGMTGELEVLGDNLFSGYWLDPGRTAETMTPDGWLRTGDLVSWNPDGSLAFLGRRKTAIVCGGLLVRPEEIDEAMCSHPAVVGSVTITRPDPDFGEIPVTVVELDHPIPIASLGEHAREHLEERKVPKAFHIVDRIPRGVSGKPDRPAVEAWVAQCTARIDEAAGHRTRDDVNRGVIEVAARVFRTDPASLGPDTRQADHPAWDSFTHIHLVLALEEAFQVRIPAVEVARSRSLRELAAAVREAPTSLDSESPSGALGPA